MKVSKKNSGSNPSGRRRIAVIATDHIIPGSLWAPIDVVDIFNRHMQLRNANTRPESAPGQGMFELKLLTVSPDRRIHSGRLHAVADDSIEKSGDRFDVVVLPAINLVDPDALTGQLKNLRPVFPWLQQQRDQGAVFAAIGSGITLLAEAGLLEGHLATVPISMETEFRRRYPKVRLDMTRAIVTDRNMSCAAALADGMQLVWRSLEQFRPGLISTQAALDLFFHDREVDHASDWSAPLLDDAGGSLADRTKYLLNEWLSRNTTGIPDIGAMAQVLAVSQRTLFRHFKASTGMTPTAYLQAQRVEMAKGALRMTDMSIDRIAARVGYSNRAYFCKIFRRYAGLSPRAFRSQSRE